MLDSIYHMTLKLFLHFWHEKVKALLKICVVKMLRGWCHNITKNM